MSHRFRASSIGQAPFHTLMRLLALVALVVPVLFLATPVAEAAGPYCLGRPATIVSNAAVINGTSGTDVIIGGSASQRINGHAGRDYICAYGGDDVIVGGSGSDRIWGGDGDDRISGGSGNDIVWGGSGNDRISGGSGSDLLLGGWNHDVLWGGSGNDRLVGEGGNDRMYGSSGDDRLEGKAGYDRAYAGSGNDQCRTSEYVLACEDSDVAPSPVCPSDPSIINPGCYRMVSLQPGECTTPYTAISSTCRVDLPAGVTTCPSVVNESPTAITVAGDVRCEYPLPPATCPGVQIGAACTLPAWTCASPWVYDASTNTCRAT